MSNSNINVQTADSILTDHRFPWKWYLSDLDKIEKNGHKVFSCFGCGGGSSMGYKLAGYDVIGCNEIDPSMMEVYRANNHPRYAFQEDIRDFLNRKVLPEELMELDILDGSPPCSTFSLAGKREDSWNVPKKFREGQKLQRLDDLFFTFIALAARLKPKVVVAENVRGLITGAAKGYVSEIFKAFYGAGYNTQLFLLNSAMMGVPQKRERVFFIAGRKDLGYPKLKMEFDSKPIPFIDVREPYGKTLPETNMSGKLLKYRIPSDRCLQDINVRVTKKKSGFTSPINHDDEPVQTITAGGYVFRMCDGLLMTDKDIISCQTFPQDYDFMGQNVQYICGMSVPPVMMANVAYEIDKQILGRE